MIGFVEMNFDWQTAVVVLVVLAAALYVARMVWARVRSMRGRGKVSLPACAGCDSAGEPKKTDAPAPRVLVQIGRAQQPPPRR